jgi:predicted dehydrogenase
MSDTLGVAVFGCGGVSAGHFSAYAADARARLVAAVDVRLELAEAAARRWGAARAYGRVEDALADPEVDVADLCLPHHLHAPVAIQAVRAGKHVFVEKPIANTLEEADAMIAAARQAGVVLMVDQTKRYQNRHRQVKKLLDAGYVGEPVLVKSAYFQDIGPAWRAMEPKRRETYWKHDGVISGIGIHALDLLRWLIGEVAEVQAIASTSDLIEPGRATEDSAILLLRFTNGCIGEVTVSYVLRDPAMGSNWDMMPLQVFGRDGALQMDADDRVTVSSAKLKQADGAVTAHFHRRPAVGAQRLPVEGMAGAIDHLLNCIGSGTTPLTDGADARRSLEVVEAAYRSLAERRGVRLPLEAAAAGSRTG